MPFDVAVAVAVVGSLTCENEESGTSDDESEKEEPRIKDVLSNLSNAVSEERASDFVA